MHKVKKTMEKTTVMKKGVSYSLVTNFRKRELPKMQIAAKASGLQHGIVAEAYDILGGSLDDHYGLYIPTDEYKLQAKEIELFFYATRRVHEEFERRGLEKEDVCR